MVDGCFQAPLFSSTKLNNQLDSSEISTTSDSLGKFSLTISNNKSGNLVSLGGKIKSSITESDFIMVHQLTNFNGLKVISPLTTIDYIYKRDYAEAISHPINEALGIESSVDIYEKTSMKMLAQRQYQRLRL